jgi:hypothetical protein
LAFYGAEIGDVRAVQKHPAAHWLDQSGDAGEQQCLSAASRAEQRRDRAARGAERDILNAGMRWCVWARECKAADREAVHGLIFRTDSRENGGSYCAEEPERYCASVLLP